MLDLGGITVPGLGARQLPTIPPEASTVPRVRNTCLGMSLPTRGMGCTLKLTRYFDIINSLVSCVGEA